MSTVGEDLTVVKNLRQSENALSIAEAGISWAIEELNTPVSEGGYGLQTAKNYSGLLGDTTRYTALTVGDELCTGLASQDQCTSWRALSPSPILFGAAGSSASTQGLFRTAYGDDQDGDSDFLADTNETIVIRSIGEDNFGAKRMIEVVVTAGSP